MPILPRQRGSIIESLISDALQPGTTAASSTTPVVVAPTPTLLRPTVPAVATTSVFTSSASLIPSITPLTPTIISQTPTVSVIVFTTTTSTASATSAPLIPTTQAVTSSSDIISSSPPIPSLVFTTPVESTPEVSAAPTTSRPATSASASASGVPANAATGAQTSNLGMSGGIIALIVVGVLLVALLAGAFTFRRVQVYRRAKRRENNYGAGPVSDTAPFPFTNVSEADMKGAEPITRDFRQGSVSVMNERPLPSAAPADAYGMGVNANSNFGGQPGFGNAMSGPYPVMAAGAGYGYGQDGRTASPAPSQAPRMMSPAPPAAPFMRTASPAPSSGALPAQYPAAPSPSLNVPAPASSLASTLRGKKRVVQTFQPTLPDELDIRDGDWVTVVHAYDDGWGLCERNGRRGVVPLECLDLGTSEIRASRRLSSLSAIRQ